MELLTRHFIVALILLTMNLPLDPEDQYPYRTQDLPIFRIGIIADVQYADAEPANNRYYRISKERLREAYRIFKNEEVDFVINLGDLIDKDFSSFGPVRQIIDSSGIKTYNVLGNHDYSVADSMKARVAFMSPSLMGYASVKSEGFRFIFLNGNDMSTYSTRSAGYISRAGKYLETLRAQGKINAMEWNGGIAIPQMIWLEQQLEYAVKKHEKVIIACHFPVYPEDIHNLLNYEEVLDLIKKYTNILAWFSGHNHAGNYGTIGQTHFITFRGMVESADISSFAIAKIYDHKVVIEGFGREQDREFTFE